MMDGCRFVELILIWKFRLILWLAGRTELRLRSEIG